jgi:threonine dehydratase
MAVKTPLLRCDALDEAAGGRVFVKAECLQRTGSFKFRGAYNRISRLTPEERRAGVVAFSSGNHAQGVAAAAKIVGCPAVIVMPADAPAMKIEATRGYGAEVVLYDRFGQSREAIAASIRAERGAILVPPFDDPLIIAGQGTVGLEAATQFAAVSPTQSADVVACPASGGGLMAGVALAFERLSPSSRAICVEPEGFDDHALSLRAGARVGAAPSARPSLCDALMSPKPGELTFALNAPRLSTGVAVSDGEALSAIAFAFRHLKLVLEPGGAVALAAALTHRLGLDGGVAVVVASGGNVDASVFAQAIA